MTAQKMRILTHDTKEQAAIRVVAHGTSQEC